MDKSMLAKAIGAVFLLIGIVGFVNNPIFGLFEVDTMHNIVHLLSGAAGLYLGMQGDKSAALYGKVFGAVYGLVTVLGLMMPDQKLLGLMHVNSVDNVLHLILTLGLLYIGFGPSSRRSSA